jgi:hypothetical protein
MPIPPAVLQFMSPAKAKRLNCTFDTPYGLFVRQLFEFAWDTPQINASAIIATPGRPTCVTMRFVQSRSDESLGKIPSLFHCKQDVELLRQLSFTEASEEVRVCRWLRYINHTKWGAGPTGWISSGFSMHAYSAALADTILDYKSFLAAARPQESAWCPPPDASPVRYEQFRTSKA